MLSNDPDELVDSLFNEMVAAVPHPRTRAGRVVGRADILNEVDREVLTWQLSPKLIEPEARVHGKTATHRVDRVFYTPRRHIAAIVEAISFAQEPATVYGLRGSLIVAADDLRDRREGKDLLAFAVYADAPQDRLDDMRESARLFKAHEVQPVSHLSMAPMRNGLASMLPIG